MRSLVALFAVMLGVLASAPADAHFKLNAPACWMSQDGTGGPQKNGPCAATPNTGLGDAAGTPTGIVTAVKSGPITVSVTATIAHPGWWRIALVEGASSTQTLPSLPDPQAQTGTTCTPAIMANPVWSTTQPILADGLPAGSTAATVQSGTQTLQVTIPASATCTTAKPCTLQVIMVMTDHPATDCYYHHCADITVGAAADAGADAPISGGGPDASLPRDAAADLRVDAGATGAGGKTGAGGATGTIGTGGETGGPTGTGGSTVVAGGSGGSPGAAGARGSGGSSVGSGGAPSGSTGTGGTTTTTGGGGPGTSSGGCGCAVASSTAPPAVAAVALLLALAAARPRRRRR